MTDFHTLLAGGNAWLFIPSAILLGALHGLEPGHSKTMMAAFIVAVRGTLGQAVLLGLAATGSHTAIVWLIALGGLYFGQHWSAEASEPKHATAKRRWSRRRRTHAGSARAGAGPPRTNLPPPSTGMEPRSSCDWSRRPTGSSRASGLE